MGLTKARQRYPSVSTPVMIPHFPAGDALEAETHLESDAEDA
jgi:hypothetical protein